MKQQFKYEAKLISSVMEHKHGFKNIDYTGNGAINSITNILLFLNLEKKLNVSRAHYDYSNIEFTLEGVENLTILDFQAAIKIFQGHILTEDNNNSFGTAEIIEEIQKFIDSVPNKEKEYEIFIGYTSASEISVKTDLNFPEHFYFRKVKNDLFNILHFFERKGAHHYQDYRHGGHGTEFLYLWAEKKKKSFWGKIFGN